MLRRTVLVALLALGFTACGEATPPTLVTTSATPARRSAPPAARTPGSTFHDSLGQHLPGRVGKEDSASPIVVDRRVPLSRARFDRVTEWKAGWLQDAFALVRDSRVFLTEAVPGFARRPAFLYPDDGCFARAEAMAYELENAGYPRPTKLFTFGELSVLTDNTPEGSVTWWYHVAPIVRAGGQLWALDPSIEPAGPIPVSDWLERQGALAPGATVTVCSPYAYSPDDVCLAGPSADPTELAVQYQEEFLGAEWDRQLELGRDPSLVLGDTPPWVQ